MNDTDKIDTLIIRNEGKQGHFPVTGEEIKILRLSSEQHISNEVFSVVAVGMLVSQPITVDAEMCDLIVYNAPVLKNDEGEIDLDLDSCVINGVYRNLALDEVRPKYTGEEMDEDYFGCVCELGNFDLNVNQFTEEFRDSIDETAGDLLTTFLAEEPDLSEVGLDPAVEIDIEVCRRCGFDTTILEKLAVDEEDYEIEDEDSCEGDYDLTKSELTAQMLALAEREAEFSGIGDDVQVTVRQEPGEVGLHMIISESKEQEFLAVYTADLDKAQDFINRGKEGAHYWTNVLWLNQDKARLLREAIDRVFPETVDD